MATAGPVAGFKIPAAWDQNRPKFDGNTVNSLRIFLRNCETVFSAGGITDEQEKKKKLLEYLDHIDTREQWEKLPTFDAGNTFESWKTAILRLYPEIEDMASGSLTKLEEICRENRPISRSELGKLRRFAMAFTNEAEKLLTKSALIVNLTLVEWILWVLEPTFASELENSMNQAAIIAVTHPLPQPPAPAGQPPVAGQPPPSGLQLEDRRGDRLPYKQVLRMADLIADNWVGRTARNNLVGGSRASALVGTTITTVPVGVPETVTIKTEFSDKMDTFASELAQLKDTSVLQEKRLTDSIKRVESSIENSMKLLSQTIRGKPPHQEITSAGQSMRPEERQVTREFGSHRERGPCYFCNGPHLVNECTIKDEFIDLGWIVVENGLIKLGNGNWIPRFPEGPSRMQKVEDHYRKQGITRDSANVKRVNMMQTFYSEHGYAAPTYFDPLEHSRVDHLYDTHDDEVRSAQVQQLKARYQAPPQNNYVPIAQNYQAPSFQSSTGIQVPMLPPGIAGQQPALQFQQIPHTQNTAPNAQPAGGVDLGQLIQLLNALKGENPAAQEQFVATRKEAEGRAHARPSRTAKPPEDRTSAAETERNWRKRGNEEKHVEFVEPEELDKENERIKAPNRRAERQIVLDDDFEEVEPAPIPFVPLEKPQTEVSNGRNLKSAMKVPSKEKAFKLVPKLDDPNIVQSLVDQTKTKTLDGITVEMLAAMNGDYAKKLRDITYKTRVPLKPVLMSGILSQQSEFPFMEDDLPIRLEPDAIALENLPPVDSLFISTEQDPGLDPGCMVCTDVVLQYYSTLEEGQAPKQIYTSMDSASLRVVFPLVSGREKVECILDSGSQIVSMALTIAERLGISWDPDIQIFMQSANGQLKKSAGLARNVPFLFGDIPIYLQIHIIDQPAYQNHKNGSQFVTIRDPNQNRRVTMPTHSRGTFSAVRDAKRRVEIEETPREDEKPKAGTGSQPEELSADFQRSSRN
ncbi:hypothetical protein MVEN_01411200 [Mycena venus]|uniref:Uncharacterized protein n=1 Tax=Mycena venus TaxID=2733690 RepID=A0A8H7CSP1_9AGAR|nr:hypothetical protein MVEN_01411200 [Mycena venus]